MQMMSALRIVWIDDMATTWYQIAERTIKDVQRQAAAEGITNATEILRLVDAAYPFGQRKYHPYQQWLKARRELLQLPKSKSAADCAKLSAWERGEPLPGERP